jgi:hypothetical protein
MRKALVAILLIGLVSAMPGAALAGKKKTKTIHKELSFGPLAPMPMWVAVDPAGCRVGEEGIHKTTVEFTTPQKGVLSVEIAEFEGDWDLYVMDGDSTLAASEAFQIDGSAPQTEQIQIPLRKKQSIQIVACNWSGGLTATGHYMYKYKG